MLICHAHCLRRPFIAVVPGPPLPTTRSGKLYSGHTAVYVHALLLLGAACSSCTIVQACCTCGCCACELPAGHEAQQKCLEAAEEFAAQLPNPARIKVGVALLRAACACMHEYVRV